MPIKKKKTTTTPSEAKAKKPPVKRVRKKTSPPLIEEAVISPSAPPAPSSTKPLSKKLERSLSNALYQFMSGKRYKPLKISELLERVGLPKHLLPPCKRLIQELIEDGQIEVKNELLDLKKEKEKTHTGTLRLHPRGFGFIILDIPLDPPQDVFIPKHLTDNAVDGDQVEIEINTSSTSEKGPEGKIIAVLKRARTHLAGTIRTISALGDVIAYVPLLGVSKPVIVTTPSKESSLKVGDRVILTVIKWGTEKEQTTAEVSSIIGHISDPMCDIRAAIEEFNIREAFPKVAIEQAKAYGKKVKVTDIKKRLDLTETICFTIDPDTAKDFDDALSLSKDRKGNYSLGVHIADVAHYVKEGTELDKEAYLRSNSTYLPGTCVPMLPEELSNELCSLKPDVIRLTVSALMYFDKEGTLTRYEIVRSAIKSAKRFTYGEAKEILDGKVKSPHSKTLKLMQELCLLLKKKRYDRGSIDFSLPEIVLMIDSKGNPKGMQRIEYDITHQLVEEFMLKANETVATDLSKRGKNLIFRVHDEPSPENLLEFLQLARTLGFKAGVEPSIDNLREVFIQAKETPFAQLLSIAFIRSMKLAQYSQDNIGHYGLALEYYCHFTSPIRRYSDLITQRLLFDEEDETIDLAKIGLHCSEQERVSFRAEMAVKTLKKLRLLSQYFEEDPKHTFNAVVTKIKPFGLSFELTDLMLDGFLHISELENDYFIYDESRQLLIGRGTGQVHRLGETLKLRLSHVDLIVLESRWELVTERPRKEERPSKDKRRRRKK